MVDNPTIQGIILGTTELRNANETDRKVQCDAFDVDPAGDGKILVPAGESVEATIRADAEYGLYDVSVYFVGGGLEATEEGLIEVGRDPEYGVTTYCGSVELEMV